MECSTLLSTAVRPLCCILLSILSSEEEPPHPPANALSVIEDIELVHKLVHGVARLGDGAKVGHEPHVIALLRGNRKRQFPRGSGSPAACPGNSQVPGPACRNDGVSPTSLSWALHSHRRSLS